MKAHPLLLICLVMFLMCAMVAPAAAQGPGPQTQSPERREHSAGLKAQPTRPGSGPQQDADGRWFMPDGAEAASAASAAPQASGGPDDFGYTWTDQEPLNWIDVSGGMDTGITMNKRSAGPFDIGFPFKFYENTRSQLYVSLYGFLTFNNRSHWNNQSQIPSAREPDEVIAPHWVPVNSDVDYVRYLRGGSAPNRWLVVEWRKVRSDCCNGDGQEEYTFEAILHENGDIVFNYGDTHVQGNFYCQSSGIEDATGLTGLATSPWCSQIAPHHAIRITRPAPAARVSMTPRSAGGFGSPGGFASFNQTIRNTGELGADTFDFASSFGWPTTLYHADGVTPLTDTDADGRVDTGSLDQGASKTIVVKTTIPAGAVAGNSSSGTLYVTSSRNPSSQKSASFRVAVPAAFAASYTQSGKPKLGYYRSGQQSTTQTVNPDSYGNTAAAATLPDGRIVQVWQQGRELTNGRWVTELYFAMTDNRGNILRAATRLTDLSSASTDADDYDPSIAVSADGQVGIAWYRDLWDSNTGKDNYNIYFLVLNSSGDVVVPPTNVTNNGGWGVWDDGSVPKFRDSRIAATPDNRFVLAWRRYTYDGSTSDSKTWYAVRAANGGEVRGPTQFPGGSYSWGANLTALADGSVLLVQQTDNKLGYGRIDSSGNVLGGLSIVDTSYPSYPDATQLPNGNIVVGWANGSAYYLVLNSALGVVRGSTYLGDLSATADYSLSVTRSGNRAVLTWGDACCDYMPNLYYALLDDAGNVVTPPMIFFSDYASYDVRLPYNGQGNTELIGDFTPPKSHVISPEFVLGSSIPLTWSGVDAGAGIASYDIWVQDGAAGAWTKWATFDANTTSGVYSPVSPGETIYFRSVATDAAGNVETDVPANGDTSTTVAAAALTGHVTNAAGEAIYNATVVASPAALNTALTDSWSGFTLYFASTSGVYDITASRSGYGTLPAMQGVDLATANEPLRLVLPPPDDAISNGGFETGDFTGWTAPEPTEFFTPTVASAAAHTGGYGLRLQAPASEAPATVGSVHQGFTLPAGAARPTLSFMVRAISAEPGDELGVFIGEGVGLEQKSYFPLSTTPGWWSHVSLDLTAFRGLPGIGVRFVLTGSGERDVYIDEVSIGEAVRGSYPAFLPLIRR